MKRISGLIVVVFLFLTVAGCSREQSGAEKQAVVTAPQAAPAGQGTRPTAIFRSISSREAQTFMETRKDLVLVDLREANELAEGYIAGSQLIPMSELAKGTRTLPADKPLLLICAVGGRSYGVGRYFSMKGYPEIYNLQGGISAWKQAGLPLQH